MSAATQGAPTWRVPGFVVQDRLGLGASGEVWRARVARSGQLVALKRIPVADAGQIAGARAEAAVLSVLDHPHLIRLHELIATPEAIVLVLDYADGGSLAQLLRRRTRLTPGEVVTALAPIGGALAYAHGEGIVHGDVSAANVLFTSIGLPLLTDLGLARIKGDYGPSRHGTPAYVDPSVVAGFVAAPPSDVFSLAAVAVHALSGRPLWPGETSTQLIGSAARAEVPDVERLLPDVPAPMRAVLARALIADPARRCTAAEFALDLRHSVEPSVIELRAGRLTGEQGTVAGRPVEPGQLTYGTRLPPVRLARRPARRMPALIGRRLGRVSRFGGRFGSWFGSWFGAWFGAWAGAWAGQRRRAVIAGTGALLVAGLVAVLLPRLLTSTDSPKVAPSPPSAPSAPARTVSARSVATPLADGAAVQARLEELDRHRQVAFATRDPALLDRVYQPGELRTKDTAELLRLVGPGCGLVGLRTAYRDVQLVSSTTTVSVVLATATLSPAVLTCGGASQSMTAASAPTVLRIELSPAADGYLIAAQQVAS